MDLIKKVETTEFSQRLRGYDIDEVDTFHADLVREIAQLQRALDDAVERGAEAAARPAPRRAAGEERPASDGRLHDPDGALQRLLAVAQRTADEAIAEAEIEAVRVVAEAEERADRVNGEADQQRRLIVTEAAAEARRVAEATREPLIAEIADLESRRDALLADLEVLDVHVNDERSRIGSALSRLQAVLDDPSGFRAVESPELSAPVGDIVMTPLVDVETDDFETDDDTAAAWGEIDEAEAPGWAADTALGSDDFGIEADVEPMVAVDDDEVDVEADVEAVVAVVDDRDEDDRGEEVEALEEDVDWVGTGAQADSDEAWDDESDWDDDVDVPLGSSVFDDAPTASVTDLESARNEVVRTAEAPLPEPEAVSSPYPDDQPKSSTLPWDDEAPGSSGPPTEAVLIDDLLGDDDQTNDRFLDELRRATENQFGEDESDAAIAAFFDQDEDADDDEETGRKRK